MFTTLALLAVAAASPPTNASDWRLVNPKAIELFEADGKLMDWALARFDENQDGYLSIMEVDDAAIEFKTIADAYRNGQVTPAEYREARAFIVARYAVPPRDGEAAGAKRLTEGAHASAGRTTDDVAAGSTAGPLHHDAARRGPPPRPGED